MTNRVVWPGPKIIETSLFLVIPTSLNHVHFTATPFPCDQFHHSNQHDSCAHSDSYHCNTVVIVINVVIPITAIIALAVIILIIIHCSTTFCYELFIKAHSTRIHVFLIRQWSFIRLVFITSCSCNIYDYIIVLFIHGTV